MAPTSWHNLLNLVCQQFDIIHFILYDFTLYNIFVRFLMLVQNYPGAKLSIFTVLVPNCPFSLSWCQIVRFHYLGAKLSVFTILVANCLVPNCPTTNILDKIICKKIFVSMFMCELGCKCNSHGKTREALHPPLKGKPQPWPESPTQMCHCK